EDGEIVGVGRDDGEHIVAMRSTLRVAFDDRGPARVAADVGGDPLGRLRGGGRGHGTPDKLTPVHASGFLRGRGPTIVGTARAGRPARPAGRAEISARLPGGHGRW